MARRRLARWGLLLGLLLLLGGCGSSGELEADALLDAGDAADAASDADLSAGDGADGDGFDPTDPSAGEPVLMAGITAAHNEVRAATGASMPRLFWSATLAEFAQAWADELARRGCGLEHRPDSGEFAQQYGENLFWGGGNAWTPQQVVEAWASELEFYDYETNGCSGVCGHYTQVVWKGTLQVGCARASCGAGAGQVWVCNYNPPGNVIGQRPY